ncbi:B-type flagellar protein FliS [Marinobacterium zhoushanense]|uniref:Flagellar secretion chaperone FliS n=1 Tax=Marinobacterium zhoushanense TaxID=1679163 RepID=A0ABQ1KQF1_9GAMM|nr:flagellar export chaperone FliS [Marinobacterium zhoushanense]GGC07682.1 B-type flagellar protein FliS [Marinobacterium zhoushanense]
MNKGINQYRQIDVETDLHNASPHRLIQMLFEGALKSIASAKGELQSGTPVGVAQHISRAVKIVGGLEEALDKEAGSELADNLERLYQHIQDSLVLAQAEKSESRLDQIALLLIELKEGWDQIAPTKGA